MVLCVGLAASISGSAEASSVTPAALVASAFHNAISSHWVHESVTVSNNSGVLYTASNDVGTTSGRQTLRTRAGDTASLVAFDGKRKMYERASINEVSSWLYIKTTAPINYADRWYLITPKDVIYANVAAGTTLSSDFGGWSLPAALRYGPNTTMAGQAVRTLTGTQVMNGVVVEVTVYISRGAKVLPVAIRTVNGATTYFTSWSAWGRSVHLTAPSGAQPYPA
jgi:hypothetical protein